MAIGHTPRLNDEDWQVAGDSFVAWIGTTEFFEIRPDPVTGDFHLTLNDTGTAQTTRLGSYGYARDAMKAAKVHLGDN